MKYALILLLATIASGCAVQTSPPGAVASESSSESSFGQLEPQASGKTYYVSGTGNDKNNGRSEKKPFRTLQRAADLTRPGDTVLAMNGLYTKPGFTGTEEFTEVLDIRRSGTPEKYIQYRAFPGHKPHIKLDNNYAGIRISAAYIVIDGFTVEGNIPNLSPDEALRRALLPPAQIAEGLNNNIFNSNGIYALPRDGQKPHHLILRNNHVFNCPATGIAGNGADYVRIENNLVHNNAYYSAYATSGVSFYQNRNSDDSTAAKMFVRNNVIYGNENKVPFWFSNQDDPGQRVITDGNGVIVDDGRNTQSFVGDASVAYKGTTVIENNLIYDNGGRAVNIYSSDNVVVRYNTTYRNARTVSSAINSELAVGDAADVAVQSNIVVPRPDRKPLETYNTSRVTFENNLFSGGLGSPESPGGSRPNLIRNGDFNVDLEGWGLAKAADAGYTENTRDQFSRNCAYVDQGNHPNTYDVYLFQNGLTLTQGSTYTLSLDAITSAGKTASFVAKFGGSAAPYPFYGAETFTLSGDRPQPQTFTFTMTGPTDAAAQLELQLGGNAPASYFCFDNVVLTASSDLPTDPQNPLDPQFINPTTDPATADFRLRSTSPARDAGTTPPPPTDLENTRRPQGPATDLGAYESF